MRILIISDTHGREGNLEEVLEMEAPFDALIHLGDTEGGEDYIREIAGCPCYIVSGNNDFFCDMPREAEIKLGKYKVLLTHGHYYYVSLGTQELRRQARARGLDIVMFGHTHRPHFEEDNGVVILNPGSLSYPRQEKRKASFMIMTIDSEGVASYETRYL